MPIKGGLLSCVKEVSCLMQYLCDFVDIMVYLCVYSVYILCVCVYI